MSFDGDIARVVREAIDQGWRHSRTERNHHQFLAPNGHDIVVTGGTPSDQRGWQNFMADMKRAGFRNGATTSLGDLLQAASTKTNGATAPPDTEKLKAPGAALSSRTIIRDLLRAHPDGTTYSALNTTLHSLKPDAHDNATSQTIHSMTKSGEVVKVRHGFYRLATETERVRAAIGVVPKEPVLTSATDAPILQALSTTVAVTASSDSTGDEQLDAELAELNGAISQVLNGFATVERLLKRHGDTMRMLAKVKKMLAGMGELK